MAIICRPRGHLLHNPPDFKSTSFFLFLPLSLSISVSLYSWTCHNVRIVNQPVPHHMLVRSLKLLTRVNTVFLSHFFSLFTPFSYHTTLIFRGYGEFYSPERTTSALYSLHYSWSLSHHWRSFLSRLAGNTFIIKFYWLLFFRWSISGNSEQNISTGSGGTASGLRSM